MLFLWFPYIRHLLDLIRFNPHLALAEKHFWSSEELSELIRPNAQNTQYTIGLSLLSQAVANESVPECCSINDQANSLCAQTSTDNSRKSIFTITILQSRRLNSTYVNLFHCRFTSLLPIKALVCLFIFNHQNRTVELCTVLSL